MTPREWATVMRARIRRRQLDHDATMRQLAWVQANLMSSRPGMKRKVEPEKLYRSPFVDEVRRKEAEKRNRKRREVARTREQMQRQR